jgi:flagellar biosynthesis chaperone FliJ
MDSSSSQMVSQGMDVGKKRQAFTIMTKSLNQLSQTAQFYAQQINDYYNNGDTKKAYMLKGYMSQLEAIMKQIRQYYQEVFPSNNEF